MQSLIKIIKKAGPGTETGKALKKMFKIIRENRSGLCTFAGLKSCPLTDSGAVRPEIVHPKSN